MAFDFPNSPTEGQVYTPSGGPTYVYHAPAWELNTTSASIPAAPFDAMAYSGMQINGGMEVSQELGSGVRAGLGFICDVWKVGGQGTAAINSFQTTTTIFPGFTNIAAMSVATGQPSLGASDGIWLFHIIEGYRTVKLAWGTTNAQPITIGFWTAHTRTGTYSIAIHNGNDDRTHVATYTQNVSVVAEYKTVTIPGCTNGTWNTANFGGIVLLFAMAAGTARTTATLNTWQTGAALAASTQVNGVAATSDVFRLTGITILPGTQAPTAAQSPNIMRPYDQELMTCRRYYRVGTPEGAGAAASATTAYFWVNHYGMRNNPTVSLIYPATISNIAFANFTQSVAAITIDTNWADGGMYTFPNFTGLSTAQPLLWRNLNSAIKFDARL